MRLVSAVISRLKDRPLGEGDLFAGLIDRAWRWTAPGVVAGFAGELDGLASTITTDFNVLALGRNRQAMARAVNRLLDLRGGIAIVERDRVVFELPLPLGGLMMRGSLVEAAAIPEVWIEDLIHDQLLVYRDPGKDGYRNALTLRRGDSISPIAFPDVTFNVGDLLPSESQ